MYSPKTKSSEKLADVVPFETETPTPNGSPAYEITPQMEEKILRKMDLRLIPMLAVLYLLAFLDRGNIGNAKIEGMLDDLHMTGQQYMTVFFFTYSAFEIPSNLLLKKLRPSRWLPIIMVAWGIVMTLMGIVQSYSGLVTARVFLGVAEAGLYPGVSYYISEWYPRHKAQYRQALFFSAASVAGAFSGILAYAIAKMDGVGGYEGWRWIFILEGLLTVVVAFIGPFAIHDSPETATFLTDEERDWVLRSVRGQTTAAGPESGLATIGSEERKFRFQYVRAALTDWQIYVGILMFWGITCPLYGISYFLPSIIKDLGYTSSTAQLLTVPIYIVAAVIAVAAAWLSDRRRERSPFVFFFMALVAIGFVIVLASTNRGVPGVVYFGVFVAVAGIYAAFPGNVAWISVNLAGDYKRAAGMALHIGVGNLSGAMASNFYRQQDAPGYILGHALELGFCVMGMFAVVALRLSYQRINRQRDALDAHLDPVEAEKLGDRSPEFRYML
ncbi:MFS general substrate transporter [Aspergillus campestris IBT 28561]|uniref:MFS general substrate transporter n=1 Tax=Aspergillus campestris (strain IBT 28561) TaxID=1392248 RepID=A0A2I1D6F5_ASPC2|nr:MFS general substrate transporter [Aspergillus campestris IBT 28561]PKY05456.1 MFS general substrate transporter [Aspergillus campestris IBT 28561]